VTCLKFRRSAYSETTNLIWPLRATSEYPCFVDSAGLPGASTKERLGMCDYSLHNVASRPAKVGDKLITRNFGAGTRGFSAPEDPSSAVCVLPGAELAFSQAVTLATAEGPAGNTATGLVAIFRQVNKDQPLTHHDALEFADGRIVLLAMLCEGQEATVLQLPAQPVTEAEKEAQTRAAYAG
jgi:hypothetical protein